MWCLANKREVKNSVCLNSKHRYGLRKTVSKLLRKGDAKCTALVITVVTKWTNSLLNRTSCLHDNSAYEADKRVSSLNSIDG